MRTHGESGFSTLEVIAAVAIIAIALVPIIGLQTQLTRSQIRLEEAHTDSTAARNALALIRDINPMQTSEGSRRLDDRTTVRWSSAPVSPLRQSINPAGFEVQLYRISAVIERPETTVTTMQFDLVGWRPMSGHQGDPGME